MGTVVSKNLLIEIRSQYKREGRKVVFTNGCFDILHRGHVEYLQKAKELGDILIVGLNTDASVKRLKGPSRPIVREDDRAAVLAALGGNRPELASRIELSPSSAAHLTRPAGGQDGELNCSGGYTITRPQSRHERPDALPR